MDTAVFGLPYCEVAVWLLRLITQVQYDLGITGIPQLPAVENGVGVRDLGMVDCVILERQT